MASPSKKAVDAIALRLELSLEALDLNQTEAALRSGIAKNTLNQWLKGKGRPQIDEAIKLCETLGLTLDWIYLGDPSCLPHRIASYVMNPTNRSRESASS